MERGGELLEIKDIVGVGRGREGRTTRNKGHSSGREREYVWDILLLIKNT